MLTTIFELLPVGLAVIAAVRCSTRYSMRIRKVDRLTLILAVLNSLLLIFAQTSWWSTYVLLGSLQGTEFANVVWTVFNSLTMIVFILLGSPRHHK
jgi:hypothetical protein